MPFLPGTLQDGSPFRAALSTRTSRLVFGDRSPRTLDLTHIGAAPNCRELVVNLAPLAAIDLAPLRGHPALAHVSLRLGCRPDLSPLAACPALQSVRLEFEGATAVDLSGFRGCARLEDLDLRLRAAATDLSPIAGCPIERLRVIASHPHDLHPLRALARLRHLGVSGGLDLRPLTGLPLETVEIAATPDDLDLTPVANPSLRRLGMVPLDVRRLDLDPLAGCGALVELVLSPGHVSLLRVSGIAGLTGLSRLDFPTYHELRCDVPLAQITCAPLREERITGRHRR